VLLHVQHRLFKAKASGFPSGKTTAPITNRRGLSNTPLAQVLRLLHALQHCPAVSSILALVHRVSQQAGAGSAAPCEAARTAPASALGA
jgi:hypothetical protein